MAMREEKADLRGNVYIMEKEKKSLELTISTLNAQEVAMKTHIQHLQDELENQDTLVKSLFNPYNYINVCKYQLMWQDKYTIKYYIFDYVYLGGGVSVQLSTKK